MALSVTTLVSCILIALGAVFWLIALAGVSALQDRCTPPCRSRQYFGLTWWTIFLQLFVLVLVAIVTFTRLAMRPAALTLLAVVSVLTMAQTNDALNIKDQNEGSEVVSRANCAAAGFIVLSMLNMLLIVTLGSDLEAKVGAAAPRSNPAPAGNVTYMQQPQVQMQPQVERKAATYAYPPPGVSSTGAPV